MKTEQNIIYNLGEELALDTDVECQKKCKTETELLDTLKNPLLPTLITNIQELETLIQKIDKDINDNNFYCIDVKWHSTDKITQRFNDSTYNLRDSLFTDEELIEYMKSLRSFYEKKLKDLKTQYVNIFYSV